MGTTVWSPAPMLGVKCFWRASWLRRLVSSSRRPSRGSLRESTRAGASHGIMVVDLGRIEFIIASRRGGARAISASGKGMAWGAEGVVAM